MTLVIAPDIFGRTPALDRLVRSLGQAGTPHQQIRIIDPYSDGTYFKKENEAYRYFTSRMDIPAYADLIAEKLKTMIPPVNTRVSTRVTLLGFSAGASAIWYLSGQGPRPEVSRGIGFYGSQIRHYQKISPHFDLRLIFPESEPHFNVDLLMNRLSATHHVSCEKALGLHGFMNEYSDNYDPRLSEKYLEILIQALGTIKK